MSDKSLYKRKRNPSHPLAVTGGCVYVHRQTLWDYLHPHHPDPYETYDRCYWCNWPQYWRTIQTTHGQSSMTSINVDHVDGDPTNNSITNLVPSCFWCNTNRTKLKQQLFQTIANLYSQTPPKKRPALFSVAFNQPAADGAIHTEDMAH
jgi:hypothetical protein